MQTQVRKRKPTTPRKMAAYKKKPKSITSKFAAKKKSREVKTIDAMFYGNYVDVYVPDALPYTILPVGTTPSIQNLATCIQGPGIANRIGNKIALKAIRVRGTLYGTGEGSGLTTPTYMRVLLVYDRQVNGAYPAVNTIFSDIDLSNAINPGDYQSSLNPQFYDRFIVLMDKFQVFGEALSTTLGPTEMRQYVIDEYVKLKGLETCFKTSSVGSPITDLASGALYLITIGSDINGDADWGLRIKTRLRYYDN